MSNNAGHNTKKVAILLGTYQGEQYLPAQLDSIQAQSHNNWQLWVADDGSVDQTLTILKTYQAQWATNALILSNGPQQGLVVNFLSLATNLSIIADYYAYADQDDIWEPDKLTRALAWLDTIPPSQPALYCSRSTIVDAANRQIGLSSLHTKPASFANALLQNIASGNTMVFNKAARNLLCRYGANLAVPYHDWWTYLLLSAYDATVYYDSYPSVRYRQHARNLIGARYGWRALKQRLCWVWNGNLAKWYSAYIQVLRQLAPQLAPAKRQVLQQFILMRQAPLLQRLRAFKSSGVYRQTFLDNVAFIIAVILRKI